eukprot:1142537-Pelagomonas_calceolata.AAC.1
MAVLDIQCMGLPRQGCATPQLSATAQYPLGVRSDQDCIRAAGVAYGCLCGIGRQCISYELRDRACSRRHYSYFCLHESIFKVWEVLQMRRGSVGLRWRICVFPSQPGCIVEGVSSWSSARESSISGVAILREAWMRLDLVEKDVILRGSGK